MVMGSLSQETEVVVVGAGPGGYVAALHAADLGKEVALVEERPRLGGVCLIEGCIPSKTLIHAVELKHQAEHAKKMGLNFGDVKVDLAGLAGWKDSVVDGLTKGIASLMKNRGIEVIKGRARFQDRNTLALEGSDVSSIKFKHCILATGSRPVRLPMAEGLPIWTSKEALDLTIVPQRLLVIGGGYIGLELGFVYAGLGSRVTVVELLPQLLTGCDEDLAAVVLKSAQKKFEAVLLGTKVSGLSHNGKHFTAALEAGGQNKSLEFDQVFMAVGRRPNTDDLGLDEIGITTDKAGFITTNSQKQTAVSHIYAIGDITHGPMLAHKASREGKVAAEVIAGHKSAFDNVAIPAVVFTDPEVAWVGLTESEAKALGRNVKIGIFPASALGRAKTLGVTDGKAKLIFDPESGLLLGAGIVGPHASDLIAEIALALEMGATVEDVAVTIHPHPTLSELVMEAAEVALGHGVHVARKK
jgi:dihydrolipoamide dehydrogenase